MLVHNPNFRLKKLAPHSVWLCCLVLCLAFGFSFPTNAFAQEKPIAEQIIEIISSNRGTVRKWVYQPKLTVVYDGDPHRSYIDGLTAEIERKVPNFPGFYEVEYFDLSQIKSDLFGNTRFTGARGHRDVTLWDERKIQLENDSSGNSVFITHRVAVDGIPVYLGGLEFMAERKRVESNIFIYIVSHQTGVLLTALTPNKGTISSLRQFAVGELPCYYRRSTEDDQLNIALIYVRADHDSIEECLFENLTQTLGLLKDSQGSTIFTYDNTTEVRPDKTADFRLLNALYDPAVKPGDPPEKVVGIYEKLLD